MSKVQFNLLPDSKLEINRSERTKKLVYSAAISIAAASFVLLLIMAGVVYGVQKKMMSDAGAKVDKSSAQLKALHIDKIITVQSQLQALPTLHQNKHVSSRIFAYLPKITPANVSITRLDVDLVKNTMAISGTADSQKTVNTFVDTLKFATYNLGPGTTSAPAFQQVVESGFNLNTTNVGYSINLQFDPKLFSNTLKDSQGKAITPTISVSNTTASGALKDPSSTLFNSTQSAGSK